MEISADTGREAPAKKAALSPRSPFPFFGANFARGNAGTAGQSTLFLFPPTPRNKPPNKPPPGVLGSCTKGAAAGTTAARANPGVEDALFVSRRQSTGRETQIREQEGKRQGDSASTCSTPFIARGTSRKNAPTGTKPDALLFLPFSPHYTMPPVNSVTTGSASHLLVTHLRPRCRFLSSFSSHTFHYLVKNEFSYRPSQSVVFFF